MEPIKAKDYLPLYGAIPQKIITIELSPGKHESRRVDFDKEDIISATDNHFIVHKDWGCFKNTLYHHIVYLKESDSNILVVFRDAYNRYISFGGDPLHWIDTTIKFIATIRPGRFFKYDGEDLREYIKTNLKQWHQDHINKLSNTYTSPITAKPKYRDMLHKIFTDAKQNKCIHNQTSEKDFVSIWDINRESTVKIKWIGSKKSCVGFMKEITSEEITRVTINKYFEQHAVNTKTGQKVEVKLKPGDMTKAYPPEFMIKYLKQ